MFAFSALRRSGNCEAKGCLFCWWNVIIHISIIEVYISAFTGQIFVILVSFDRVSLRFLFSVQISDISTPKCHKDVKTAKFWAILSRFYLPQTRLDGHHSKTVQFFETAWTFLRRWLGYHVLKLGEDWSPISEIRPGVCAPKMCKIGKWAIRKSKTAGDGAILSASGK